MKFPQFVKEFRNENKDLGMSHAECMKSEEIKRAYKELCGCPHIEQKDGNVNVILQFGEKDNDADAVSPDGQPKQFSAKPGIPQRRPTQSAEVPPMAQIPPLPPTAQVPPQPYVPEEPYQIPVVTATALGNKDKVSFFQESDTDDWVLDEDTDDEPNRQVDLSQFQSPNLGDYRILKQSPESSSVEYVRRIGTDEREAERQRRAEQTGNFLDFTMKEESPRSFDITNSPGLSEIDGYETMFSPLSGYRKEPKQELFSPSVVYEDERIPRDTAGGAVLNCCPAVRGGSLRASDLRKLLSSSYSGEPVDNWKMEKSMSSKNSKVYRNPSTGQVVVAHKGTQGTMDWGNNLVYAVTGEMGYKQTKRYKDARKVQKAAENAFGRDMVTTIGHSQGGLQAQMLGGDSKEVITVNKATRPGEVLYGSSKKGNQTDVRTDQDPVSAFRSPFASRNKTIQIDADTRDPLDAHSYEHLEKLGDMDIGEKENYEVKNPLIGQGIADSRLAGMEADYKRKLWEGKFNVPGEWDDKLKTWVSVKAYRAALARMDPERKRNLKLLQARLDKDRDAEAKLAIKQKKAQKGRFK